VFSINKSPKNVQKGNAPMGPSKNTSKLPLIIKASSIEVIAKVFPVNFLVNKGLNKDTNQIIQVIKTI
jgi:hypothetical protein